MVADPASVFGTWKVADQRWLEENEMLAEIVFQWFLREGEWPTTEALHRFLFRGSVTSVDPQTAADSKPRIPGQLAIGHQDRFTLGARHLLNNVDARSLLGLLVAATAEAVEAYRGSADPPSVSYDNPKFFQYDSATVIRLPAFLSSDYPNIFGGGAVGDQWNLLVNGALVNAFHGVADPDDYVDRQSLIIQGWAEDQETRVSQTPRQSVSAFVIMPFDEEWSDEVYAFIGRAVARLDGRINAIRADQISQPGRITDQIAGAISAADIVIADITGRNANVFWELGYAYALDKPCVLLMRRGDVAPFDIYDHRRIDYSSPPTSEDEARLGELLSNAIVT